MRQHDLAWHWDSSLHLALVPKEIPTPEDFNKNKLFQNGTKSPLQKCHFFEDQKDSELMGETYEVESGKWCGLNTSKNFLP